MARDNPLATVIGIDVSAASIAATEKLKQRHNLENLSLHRLDIESVDRLGRQFDLIVCFGVLHHLRDATTGLKPLGRMLAPDGVMHIALYNSARRYGLTMVQEALGRLGLKQTPADVALARTIAQALPHDHPVRLTLSNEDTASASDSEIADALLHPLEQAYSVPEVLALVERAGLDFRGWFDNLDYYPDGAFGDQPDIVNLISQRPDFEQWPITQLLTPKRGYHQFLVGSPQPARPLQPWNHRDWMNYVPSYRRGLAVHADGDGSVRLSRAWHQCRLSGADAAIFQAISGTADVHSLLLLAEQRGWSPRATPLLQRLWRLGHIALGTHT